MSKLQNHIINRTGDVERDKSEKTANGTVERVKSEKTVNGALESRMCTGCGACLSVCPKEAIALLPDEWGYYRSVIDPGKCIECGKCIKACPALGLPEKKNTSTPDCYAFISSDEEVLRKSSSGGIFTTLAREIFAKGGVVVGAAWNDALAVEHIVIESEAELWKLQKSKYLQSYIGDTLKKVRTVLETGRAVLYVGTPCQISGLRKYLGREYDNLYAVDFLCGNAPSPMFFKKYAQQTYGDQLKRYEFRHKDKDIRWDSIYTQAELKDGTKIVHHGPKDDDYQRVYHNHTMCAWHCEHCKYQAFPRTGDLTIGDFWGLSKRDPSIDTFKGVSIVLCNNEKGAALFEGLPDKSSRLKKKVPLEWMGGNGYSRKGGKNYCSPQRDTFYEAILKMPFKEAVNYALKPGHGIYRECYKGTCPALRYDCNMLHFRFESHIWEELVIEGKTTLIVKDGMWKELGHQARLAMSGMLKNDRPYRLSARFKIKTDSKALYFHLADSGSKQLQIVYSAPLGKKNSGEDWIEFSEVFTPDTDYYDEIMFGATQVSGTNNFLMIDYIDISEV